MNQPTASPDPDEHLPWWRHLNGYHWYVFALAALGWLFDTMDGQIFLASRSITMKDLMPNEPEQVRTQYGGYVTSLFIIGWATGGLIFGIVGDRWGRAKTMALTIGIYAVFTGLSGVAQTWWQFGIFRFLTGLGVGGEFAAGAALVAEVMPPKARARALGMLQALSAVGNIIGASLMWAIEPRWGWQGLYFVGAFPAVLAVVVRLGLKEPEKWVEAKAAAKASGGTEHLGSLSDLFTNPQWRRNTLVGLGLAIAGVIGLWGVGFWSPELIDNTLPTVTKEMHEKFDSIVAAENPDAQLALIAQLTDPEKKKYLELLSKSLGSKERKAIETDLKVALTVEQKARMSAQLQKSLTPTEKTEVKSKALILQQVGAFFGMFLFSVSAGRFGRRASFFAAFVLAWASIAITFLTFEHREQIWYLWPLLGFGALAPFGGYALYFPELFPTRLRTTGTGFCYNVGRYIAAIGPLTLGALGVYFYGKFEVSGFRVAAMVVASSYLLGLITLIWAPETKGKPLPE